jgi:hypothetical protein
MLGSSKWLKKMPSKMMDLRGVGDKSGFHRRTGKGIG